LRERYARERNRRLRPDGIDRVDAVVTDRAAAEALKP
jgi:hypothetical protein